MYYPTSDDLITWNVDVSAVSGEGFSEDIVNFKDVYVVHNGDVLTIGNMKEGRVHTLDNNYAVMYEPEIRFTAKGIVVHGYCRTDNTFLIEAKWYIARNFNGN